MEIFKKLTDKIGVALKKLSLTDKLYMGKGSGLVCADKQGTINKKVEILASHIDTNLEDLNSFPQFTVVKTTSRDGQIGTHKKIALILDTDSQPTENSFKLLTSGLLYEIISDLQNQINELKSKIQ